MCICAIKKLSNISSSCDRIKNDRALSYSRFLKKFKMRNSEINIYIYISYPNERMEWTIRLIRGSVCVLMAITKGVTSFVLDGVNLGDAYEGIILDDPFISCILLFL